MVNNKVNKINLYRKFGPLSNIKTKETIRKYLPGQHGQNQGKLKNKKHNNDYALQLNEKQKLRFNYNITESQLYNYLKKSSKKKGIIGTNLIEILEMRLDSILVNANLVSSLLTARQIISHGHILVNKHKINIPSFICKEKDKIEVKNIQKSINLINNKLISKPMENLNLNFKPDDNLNTYAFTITSSIKRNSIPLKINENLILEYYSRK